MDLSKSWFRVDQNAHSNFIDSEPKFTIFSPKLEEIAVDHIPILDISIHSRDICDRSLNFSEISPFLVRPER